MDGNETGPTTRRRTRAVAGVALAGVLGLGAVGVAVPAVAAPDDATTAPAAAEDRAARRAEAVRETLEPLVQDGTITAAQADAVVARLQEAASERQGRRQERRTAAVETAATAIGIEASDLASQLHDGATMAEVATANGVDPQAVVDALVAEANARIDEAVADGRLDADQAAIAQERAAERITRLVQEGRPRR